MKVGALHSIKGNSFRNVILEDRRWWGLPERPGPSHMDLKDVPAAVLAVLVRVVFSGSISV